MKQKEKSVAHRELGDELMSGRSSRSHNCSRDLIHKVINMPDYVSELPDETMHIKTRDGRILKDIYVDGDDNVIEVEK